MVPGRVRLPRVLGMAVRLHALVVRTPDPERLSTFWDGLLADSEVPFLLAYEPSDQPKAGLNQIHVHLTSNVRIPGRDRRPGSRAGRDAPGRRPAAR